MPRIFLVLLLQINRTTTFAKQLIKKTPTHERLKKREQCHDQQKQTPVPVGSNE